jgi:FK506-binding protein 1
MGVTKEIIKPGNGVDIPKKNDEVSMEYTGARTGALSS